MSIRVTSFRIFSMLFGARFTVDTSTSILDLSLFECLVSYDVTRLVSRQLDAISARKNVLVEAGQRRPKLSRLLRSKKPYIL